MKNITHRILCLISLSFFSLSSVHANFLEPDIFNSVTRITDNMYIIVGPVGLPSYKNRGFRNNPVIVLVQRGVVLVDPGGSAVAGEWVVKQVRALTSDPIVAVFNSHAHAGHWMANETIKASYPDVVIYGHPAMKALVQSVYGKHWLDRTNRLTEGAARSTKVVAPDKVVVDGEEIDIGGTKFRIYHPKSAHSNNDILVEVVNQNAIITGDIVRNKFLGTMDAESSFKGSIEMIDFILSKNFKYYIPGHGPGLNFGKGLAETYRHYLSTIFNQVNEYYDTGLSDFEMKPLIIDSLAEYKDWVGFNKRIGQHIGQAYLEVEEGSFLT